MPSSKILRVFELKGRSPALCLHHMHLQPFASIWLCVSALSVVTPILCKRWWSHRSQSFNLSNRFFVNCFFVNCFDPNSSQLSQALICGGFSGDPPLPPWLQKETR